jgi:hypothetical protein
MRTPLFLVAIGMIACSSSSSGSGFDGKKDPSSSGAAGSSGGFGGGTSSGSSGAASDGCSEEAKLVYVVSEENDLYSFRPDTVTFTKIGPLECPAAGLATPNSMAIDRSGTAWVNYTDGSLFKVSTKDASCQSTSFKPGQSGFTKFGMAFATNGANTHDETLYVCGIEANNRGKGLARIDLSTMKLTPIGDFSDALRGMGAELTGTGDGRLFGFFTTSPNATLAQIQGTSAATSNDVDLAGVSTGLAWAFSFWGGDFWFYTAGAGGASRVTRLQPSSGNKISVVKADVGGFRIVGAGVSTCAPTGPVR